MSNNEDINPTYTIQDFENANKFATSNLHIRLLHRMHKKFPNIVSHVNVNIRDATDKDYYIPPTLKHAAKVVDLKFNEDLCKMMSCNSLKEKTTCKETDEASYYYVGDKAYDLQCQPACFFSVNPTYNEKKERSPDSYMLNWHNNKCKILPPVGVAWEEKTFYRSNVQYEVRFNDMPTGFSRIKDEDPLSTGISYKSNETYCQYFDRKLNPDDSCSFTWFEKGLDAVLGMSLINSVKSGIRYLNNGGKVFDLPTNLPKLPEKIPYEFTKEGWKKNIKDCFELPDFIDTRPKLVNSTHTLLTDRHKVDALNENISTFTQNLMNSTTTGIRLNTSSNDDGKDETDNIEHVKKRLKRSLGDALNAFNIENKKYDPTKNKLNITSDLKLSSEKNISKESGKKYDNSDKKSDKSDKNKDSKDDQPYDDKVAKILDGLLELITSAEFWEYLAISVSFDVSLIVLKKLLITLIEKTSNLIIKQLALIAGRVGTKVLLGSIRGVAIQAMTHLATQMVSKFAVGLAKITSCIASVIGWVLLAGAIFDLILTFWDPAGYNKMHPPGYAKALFDMTDAQLREMLGMSEPELTVDFLIGSVLTQDELIECNIEGFFDHLVYLDALTVNSDGSLINKGPPIDLNDFNGNVNDNDYINKKNEYIAKRYHFNNREFKEYNANFLKRINLNNTLNNINYGFIGFTALFLLLDMKMVALFFLFIVLLIFLFTLIEARYNFVYNIMKELNIKT